MYSTYSNYGWDCIYVSNDPVEENNLKIYPNPASSVIYIESVGGITAILVYNSLGIMLDKILMNGEKKTTLDVGNYASGLYHFTVITNENEMLQQKIIIR